MLTPTRVPQEWELSNLAGHITAPALTLKKLQLIAISKSVPFGEKLETWRGPLSHFARVTDLFVRSRFRLPHFHLIDLGHNVESSELQDFLEMEYVGLADSSSVILQHECHSPSVHDPRNDSPIRHKDGVYHLIPYLSNFLDGIPPPSLTSLLVFLHDCPQYAWEYDWMATMLETRLEEASLAFAEIEFPSRHDSETAPIVP